MIFEKKAVIGLGILLTVAVVVIAMGASMIEFSDNPSYVSPFRISLVCNGYGVGWINVPNIGYFDGLNIVKAEIVRRVKTLVSEGWDPILALNEIASKPINIEKSEHIFKEVNTSIWFEGRPLKFLRDCEYASSVGISLDLGDVDIQYGKVIDWHLIVGDNVNIIGSSDNQTD